MFRTRIVRTALVVSVLATGGVAFEAVQGSEAASPAPPPTSVALPDLGDPAVRQQFVNQFAPGSFGIKPQDRHDVPHTPTQDPGNAGR